MARIEFESEVSMDELRGFSRVFFDGKKNAYTTDRLTDDEFNFISGMNYAVNHFLSNLIENLDEDEEMNDSVEMLRDLKMQVGKNVLTAANCYCNTEISRLITEFIDSRDD